MRILLWLTILAEAAFILISVWRSQVMPNTATATESRHPRSLDGEAVRFGGAMESTPLRFAQDENKRLREAWRRARPSHDGPATTSPGTEVSFEGALDIIAGVLPCTAFTGGVPPVLAGALGLSEDERKELDGLWNDSIRRVKELELRYAFSANADLAAASAANLEASIPKVRAKLQAENLTPDEIDARIREMVRLMTYTGQGEIKVRLDSAAVAVEASPLLESLHSSVEDLLHDGARAALAAEAFARLILGGRDLTLTTHEFLFGSNDDVIVTTERSLLTGTELSPEGEETPVTSAMITVTSSRKDIEARFDHLIDVDNRRLREPIERRR